MAVSEKDAEAPSLGVYRDSGARLWGCGETVQEHLWQWPHELSTFSPALILCDLEHRVVVQRWQEPALFPFFLLASCCLHVHSFPLDLSLKDQAQKLWEFRDDLMLIRCPWISNVKTELGEGHWLAQMYTLGGSFSTLLNPVIWLQ